MEQSFSEQGLQIYFVRQSENPSAYFLDAFKRCEEASIHPQWIDERECISLELNRKVVFVVESFQGPLFARLAKASCTLLGAPCVMECLRRGEPNPSVRHPVYTLAMAGLRVCATGFSVAQREDLAHKVEYMGGVFDKDLHQEVTHLVVTQVSSNKYQMATDQKIPVMLESWIHETWDANQKQYASALDEPFCSLICPPFLGLNITITQFPKHKKDKIKSIIENNGGKYSPEMTSQFTDVLVVASPSGEKYAHAKKWKITCVSEAWVSDSAKAGYSLKYPDYLVEAKKTSTPDRDSTQLMMNCSTVSSIVSENKRSCINETMMASFVEPLPVDRRDPPDTPEKEPDATAKLMKISLAEVRKAGLFLDGCKVYVSGGAPALQDKLRKLLNTGGATRFDDISESLSHILRAGASLKTAEFKELGKLSRKPPVVPLLWLLKSIELKHPADIVGPQGTEPPSPLSKRGMQMFETVPKMTISPRTAKNDLAVVQQYLSSAPAARTPPPISTSLKETTEEEDEDEELAKPLATFQGLRVQLIGLTKSEMSEARLTVEQLGGQVVFTGSDYVVGPCRGVETMLPNQVNVWWLEECKEKTDPVAVQYYHRPILLQPSKPLQGVVLAVSNYGGAERSYLSSLATELGALYQDVFAKKTTADRGATGSTHLVCPAPEGPKYAAAVKWKLPAVTKDWLLKCAEMRCRVAEEPYLLTQNMRLSAVPSPAASILSTSIASVQANSEDTVTPVRITTAPTNFATPFTPRVGGSRDSILANEEAARIARLSLTSFRNAIERMDPDYLSTPETPYGAVVKDDPSPNTRKKWKRYLNSIPDTINHEEIDLKMGKEKINKRLRIEDLDEESDDDQEDQTFKKRKESIDSNVDEELLKDYNSQKMAAYEAPAPPEQEKENRKVSTVTVTSPPNTSVRNPVPTRERVFMVTGVIEQDMEHMIQVVNMLGGRMSTQKHFDPNATHLVTSTPSRSEKLLASMAAGLWVVHPQFLLQSSKAGHFLSEEGFEWGNEAAAEYTHMILRENQRAKEMATACHKWRLKAAAEGCAFKNFKAMLLGASVKTAAFQRMIVAGGGEVVPFGSDLTGVTHCFVEASKTNTDLRALQAANVPCYNPIYLNDFLINEQNSGISGCSMIWPDGGFGQPELECAWIDHRLI